MLHGWLGYCTFTHSWMYVDVPSGDVDVDIVVLNVPSDVNVNANTSIYVGT